MNVPNAAENHGCRLTSDGRWRSCYRSGLKNTALTSMNFLRTHFLTQAFATPCIHVLTQMYTRSMNRHSGHGQGNMATFFALFVTRKPPRSSSRKGKIMNLDMNVEKGNLLTNKASLQWLAEGSRWDGHWQTPAQTAPGLDRLLVGPHRAGPGFGGV